MLDAGRAVLPYKLRQAVSLIAGTGLDWVALINHRIDRHHQDRRVQKDWARGFWSGPTN